jgi:hypothetical protein
MNYTHKPTLDATTVTDRVVKYINNTPPAIAGNDGHTQTLKLASSLVHGFGLDASTATTLLLNYYNPKCDPPWEQGHIERKVSEALKNPPIKPRGWLLNGSQGKALDPVRMPKKKITIPKPDPIGKVQTLLGDFRCTEDDVRDASPHKIPRLIQEDHFHRQGAMLIEYLFDKDDLVNIVEDSKQDKHGKWYPVGYGLTQPRADWTRTLMDPLRRLDGGRWIRMNPMDGKGVSDANVTAFNYGLIEFDDMKLGLQLSLLAKLQLKIVAIIYSGNKSYHAWWKVGAKQINQYRETVAKVSELMAKYGADKKNKNPSRMSRLAGTYRGDQTQRLVYLNPEPSTEGIL